MNGNDERLSVRLSSEQVKGLGIVARVEGGNPSEVVRAAVDDYVARRLADEDFQKRLEEVMAEERQILERAMKRSHA